MVYQGTKKTNRLTDKFYYSVLQYHHSAVLGEVLNVGLLLIFPQQNHITFLRPSHYQRLKYAYPNLSSLKILQHYNQAFEAQTQEWNENKDILNNFSEKKINSLLNSLIPEDESALQFAPYRTVLLYTSNLEAIKQDFYQKYLKFYDLLPEKSKKDESYLLKIFKENLSKKNASFENLFQKQVLKSNFVVNTRQGNQFTFDLAWVNGNTHLINPLSFDLLRPESIIRKATLHFGRFTLLEQENKNYCVDVLLAKPQKKELFKVYDQALHILQKPKGVSLFEESQIEAYSEQVWQNIVAS